jgi:hypothetical protein
MAHKYTDFLTNARAYAKLIGVLMDNGTAKTNGFGGFKDSATRLRTQSGNPNEKLECRQNHRATLVVTCRNCGDGTSIDITNAIVNFKS